MCRMPLSLNLQKFEAPDEKELVCAARNNNGIGNVPVPQDRFQARYGKYMKDGIELGKVFNTNLHL